MHITHVVLQCKLVSGCGLKKWLALRCIEYFLVRLDIRYWRYILRNGIQSLLTASWRSSHERRPVGVRK